MVHWLVSGSIIISSIQSQHMTYFGGFETWLQISWYSLDWDVMSPEFGQVTVTGQSVQYGRSDASWLLRSENVTAASVEFVETPFLESWVSMKQVLLPWCCHAMRRPKLDHRKRQHVGAQTWQQERDISTCFSSSHHFLFPCKTPSQSYPTDWFLSEFLIHRNHDRKKNDCCYF